MKSHQFYSKYANTPLKEREKVILNVSDSPITLMTLNDVYAELNKIDDKIRPDIIRRDQILEAVEKFLK